MRLWVWWWCITPRLWQWCIAVLGAKGGSWLGRRTVRRWATIGVEGRLLRIWLLCVLLRWCIVLLLVDVGLLLLHVALGAAGKHVGDGGWLLLGMRPEPAVGGKGEGN